MSQPPGAVRVKEEEVEGFVCLVRPRRGLAGEVAMVKKEEDQEEGLVQLATAPEPAIKSSVVNPSNEELAFCPRNNRQDDSTRDQSTLHQAEPTATSANVSTDHQPVAPSRVSPPPHSASRKRVQCSVCGKSFPTPSHLRIHHRVHTGERPFVCTFPGCTKAFAEKSSLKAHEHRHSNTRPFRCTWPGCEMAFTTSSHLTVHTRRHTGDRPYRCTWSGCNKAFVQNRDLTSHLNTHTGARPHRCPHCPSAFNHRSHLTAHLRLHTGQLPYQCGLCSKRFNQKSQLTGHMYHKHRDHTKTLNAQPQVNSTALQSSQTLPTTVLREDEQPPVSTSAAPHPSIRPWRHHCPQCGKSFISPSRLLSHQAVHTQERPFVCTVPGCSKAFKQKCALTRHLRLHSTTHPFKCTWLGCTKAFTTSTHQQDHLNTHTGEPPHHCPHCLSAFAYRSALTRHLRLHTGQLLFQCGLCFKRFNQKANLKTHIRHKHREHQSLMPNAHSPVDSTAPQSTMTSATAHPSPVQLSSEPAPLAPVQVKTETEDQMKIKKEEDST